MKTNMYPMYPICYVFVSNHSRYDVKNIEGHFVGTEAR